MKIALVGGGTAGSVMPLLAVREELKKKHEKLEFLYLGTKGPENVLLAGQKLEIRRIFSGKVRRYFSFKNITDLFLVFIGFLQSFFLLKKEKVSLVFTAGSYVAVPVVFAAWLLKIPVVAHQQDLVPGLANRAVAPFCKTITLSIKESEKGFSHGSGLFRTLKNKKSKFVYTGNPIRAGVKSKSSAKNLNFVSKDRPVLLILGGSSGAKGINKLVWEALPELVKTFQVVHQTGSGDIKLAPKAENYYPIAILKDEFSEAIHRADIVVTRAGFSTLSELSINGKVVVVIPIPRSHQEYNARFFSVQHAALLANQENTTPENFANALRKLLFDQEMQKRLSKNIKKITPPDAAKKVASILEELLYKQHAKQ